MQASRPRNTHTPAAIKLQANPNGYSCTPSPPLRPTGAACPAFFERARGDFRTSLNKQGDEVFGGDAGNPFFKVTGLDFFEQNFRLKRSSVEQCGKFFSGVESEKVSGKMQIADTVIFDIEFNADASGGKTPGVGKRIRQNCSVVPCPGTVFFICKFLRLKNKLFGNTFQDTSGNLSLKRKGEFFNESLNTDTRKKRNLNS